MGVTMNFSQARPRAIEGLLKEKVLLMKPPNLGKTTVYTGHTYDGSPTDFKSWLMISMCSVSF